MKTHEALLEPLAIKHTAAQFRAAIHPLRLQILALIKKKKQMNVQDIYRTLHIEQSVVSSHLAILRHAQLVNATRDGRFIYYSLNANHLELVQQTAEALITKPPKKH